MAKLARLPLKAIDHVISLQQLLLERPQILSEVLILRQDDLSLIFQLLNEQD